MKRHLAFFALVLMGLVSCQKNNDSDTGSGTTDTTSTTAKLDFSAVEKVFTDSAAPVFDNKFYAIIQVNGKTVYTKSGGGYDGETRQLVASCSKWLSGAVIMSMVDEGKIKLSDSIGKYLPIFTTYGKGKITIAQCFSHTSGLINNTTQGFETDQNLTLAQAVDSIAQYAPLLFAPGTKFNYGQVSMQIAGRICEVVSGKKWADLFADKMATPLGMTNTDFGPLNPNPIVAGGVRSTPNDYMKFLYMIMNKGVAANGTRILSEASITAMEQSQVGSATVFYSPYPINKINTTNIYGVGNWRDYTGTNDVLIEDSSPGAFGSHPWVNRGKKVTGFIFTYIVVNGYTTTLPTALTVRSLTRGIVK